MKRTILFEGITSESCPGEVAVGSLMSYLEGVVDPRAARGKRYALVHLLTLLILAKLGGEDTLRGMAEWVHLRGEALVALLKLPRPTLPHQTTYERVLDKLDIEQLEQQVSAYFAAQMVAGETINVDGKTLCGSIPTGATRGVHLLCGYAVQQGVVLRQVAVATKNNEITAAPSLLAHLELSGKVVTGDALLTQQELCTQIVAAGGDYVLPVKANHACLQHAIAASFLPLPACHGYPKPPLPTHCAASLSKQRGRIEQRWLDCHPHLNDYLDWTGLGQVFRLQRVVHHLKTKRLTYEVVFGITSLRPEHASPQALLAYTQSHWHIENRLHYVRDVSFHEDACQIRQPHRQHLLATLNNLVIGLIRQCDFDFIPQARRYFSLHFIEAFHLLC